MVKTKYQRMNKEEKKNARIEYFNTDKGKNLKTRMIRLLIYGILLLGFGIYIIIDAVIKDDAIIELVYGIGLIVVAFAFIISRYFIIIKKTNDYLTKPKKKK